MNNATKSWKALLIEFAIQTAIWAVLSVAIHWLASVSWWVASLFASAFAGALQLQQEIRKSNELLASSDAELARVSALAGSLQQRLEAMDTRLAELEAREPA